LKSATEKPLRIKVEYKGFDPELDQRIRDAIESIGYEWYAQGTTIETGIRDLAFKLKE